MVRDMANGTVNGEGVLDSWTKVHNDTLGRLKRIMDLAEIGDTRAESILSCIRVPTSEKSMTCHAWLARYFELIGDAVPNLENELHIEACEAKDIYAEYQEFMVNEGKQQPGDSIGYIAFLRM
jgi:hypothetical protein